MYKKRFIYFILIFTTLYANEPDINKYVKTEIDIDELVDQQIQEYAQKNNFNYGFDEKTSKYFIYAIQPVTQKPTDPDFVKSLITAYEKAYFNAQKNFIMDIFGKMLSQKESSLYIDNSTNARSFDTEKNTPNTFISKINRVVDKTLTLTEKKLDKELETYGINNNEFKNLSESEKKTLYKNKYISKTIKRAFGSVKGFVPLKSFVVNNKEGQFVVGIVAMRSPKTSQVAKDISLKRKSFIEGKGQPLSEIIPKDPKKLLNEIGLRLVFDQTNQPALISYGQWGFNSKGLSSYMRIQAKENSKSIAKDIADAMISDFLNGNMLTSSTKEHGEIIENIIKKQSNPDNMIIDQTINNIIEKINEKTKLRSSMNLSGISTIKRWSTKNKFGHYVSGVIRVWRYSGLDIANSIINNKPLSKKHFKENTTTTSQTIQNSIEYNTINDF
jgi:hypothetical protein